MAKDIEKEAEFVSFDDAQISKLQNKKHIKLPMKRLKKQKHLNSSDKLTSSEELSSKQNGNFFQRISVMYFIDNFKFMFLIILSSILIVIVKKSKINIPLPPSNYKVNETTFKDLKVKPGKFFYI